MTQECSDIAEDKSLPESRVSQIDNGVLSAKEHADEDKQHAKDDCNHEEYFALQCQLVVNEVGRG